MSAPTTQAERDGSEEPRIIRQFKQNLEFTGGTAVKYDASALFDAGDASGAGQGEEIGRRFHSAPVVRLSDAKQMQLGHVRRGRRALAHLRLRRTGPTARTPVRRCTGSRTG